MHKSHIESVGEIIDLNGLMKQVNLLYGKNVATSKDKFKGILNIKETEYYNKELMRVTEREKSTLKIVPISNLIGVSLIFRKLIIDKNTCWQSNYKLTIVKEEYNKSKSDKSVSVIEKIYDLLLDKENWRGKDNSLSNLITYIRYSFEFANKYISENMQGITWNMKGDKFLFNTRLYSKYGNYIVILCSIDDKIISIISIADSSKNFMTSGFKDEPLPEPLPISCIVNDLIFDGKEEDFIYDNIHSLDHIINQRRDRFGLSDKYKCELEIATGIRNSVKLAVDKSKTDYNYIAPMFSTEDASIQFLIPVNFTCDNKGIECALIVRKNNKNLWEIPTILSIKDAYFNARVIQRPDVSWLREGVH